MSQLTDQHTPEHLQGTPPATGHRALSALATVTLLDLLVAANPQASSASATTTGEPTVHMSGRNFVQNVVLVPKGSKLLPVNDTHIEHMLENGSWTSSGTAVTTVEPGAPVLHNVESTGGSLSIVPFNTAGTFHIYCTIHRGMNLTIVVQ